MKFDLKMCVGIWFEKSQSFISWMVHFEDVSWLNSVCFWKSRAWFDAKADLMCGNQATSRNRLFSSRVQELAPGRNHLFEGCRTWAWGWCTWAWAGWHRGWKPKHFRWGNHIQNQRPHSQMMLNWTTGFIFLWMKKGNHSRCTEADGVLYEKGQIVLHADVALQMGILMRGQESTIVGHPRNSPTLALVRRSFV